MKLSKEQVNHIATLARIDVTEVEKEKFSMQISAVLEYMDILNEVDTTVVKPTAQVTGLKNIYRDDQVIPCDASTLEKIIDNFPDRIGNLLRVPAVFVENKEIRKV